MSEHRQTRCYRVCVKKSQMKNLMQCFQYVIHHVVKHLSSACVYFQTYSIESKTQIWSGTDMVQICMIKANVTYQFSCLVPIYLFQLNSDKLYYTVQQITSFLSIHQPSLEQFYIYRDFSYSPAVTIQQDANGGKMQEERQTDRLLDRLNQFVELTIIFINSISFLLIAWV